MNVPRTLVDGPSAELEPLITRRTGNFLELILNRPRAHNGLDRETAIALLDGVCVASRDNCVRAILISGNGPSFCSGDDLTTLRDHLAGDPSTAPADIHSHDAHYIRICEEILSAPKPVITALHGAVMGAGLEIACAADLRIGATDAVLSCPLVHIGHIGATVMLQRIVGPAKATQMYLTAARVKTDEALRLGLLDEVVNSKNLLARARELAGQLAAGPTRAIGLYKELRQRVAFSSDLEALRLQDRYHERSRTEVVDSHEGLRAFLEKRSPEFTGR